MSNLEDNTTIPVVVESSISSDHGVTLNNNNDNKLADDDDHHHNNNNEVHQNHDVDDLDGGSLLVRDVVFWRRKKISGLVLVATTILWTLLQSYSFNLIPLASWACMAFVTLIFLHGSFLRLFNKDLPNMDAWEMTEQRARELAESTKRVMEGGVKWMFYVSCEREWYIFVAVIAALLLLSYLGRYMDLLTFLYTGTLVGMTVPAIYVNKEDKIKSYGEKARVQGMKTYQKFDEKIFSKLSHKLKNNREKKAKKVE